MSEQRPGLPAALDDVIAHAMAKATTDRPRSASALMDEAERAFGQRVRAVITPPGPIEAAEEAGVRRPERKVTTRASRVRDVPPPAATTAPRARPAPPPPAVVVQAPAPDAPAAPAADAAPSPPLAAAAPAPPPAAGPEPATHRRRALAFLLAGIIAAAAVVGVLVGDSGGAAAPAEPSLAGSITTSDVGLSFPSDWARSDRGAVDGLSLRSAATVAPRDGSPGVVAAGLTDATGPALLPGAYLRRLGTPPARGDRVRLGRLQAYRYRPDARTEILVAPTTRGVLTVACTATPARCERIASTVALQRGAPYGLGPDPAYAGALTGTLQRLAGARGPALAQLRAARRPATQADAAGALQRAYDAAARSLARRAVSPADRDAHDAIVAALRRSRDAYSALAAAAGGGDRGRYARASAAVHAGDGALQGALAALGDAGYRVDG